MLAWRGRFAQNQLPGVPEEHTRRECGDWPGRSTVVSGTKPLAFDTVVALRRLGGAHRRLVLIPNLKITDAGMQQIGRLDRLRVLCLDFTGVGDDGMKHLAGLTQLEELDLSETAVGDAGLQHLAGLRHLRRLLLTGTRGVTDAGLAHVGHITSLRELRLPDTVSDAGLEHLYGLRELRILRVTVDKWRLTEAGVSKLQQALPQCEVVR